MTNNDESKEKPEQFYKDLYRLKLHYPLLVNLLDIYFGGDVVHTDSDINKIYLQHCLKIEKILSNSNLGESFDDWKPFENLLSLDPDGPDLDWEYGRRQRCLDLYSRIEELYIKNGNKSFELEPAEKNYLDNFQKLIENYKFVKNEQDKKVMENTKKEISKHMSPVTFEKNSELQQNQSTLTGKLKVEPDFLIKKFESLLTEIQPLKTKLNGTGELSLLDISKRIRNILKISYEDGAERVKHFNSEGGTFYKNLHSDFNIPNSNVLSAQDVKYLENILWHEIKIKEFLDEIKIIKEIQNVENNKKIKERVSSSKEEKESDYTLVEAQRPPYFRTPPILPTSEEIENEIRKTKEAYIRRNGDDSSSTIPPTPPNKVTPHDGWSKKRKIEVGSILAIVAIVISIMVSPIGLNFLIPPEPEIQVTDLNAQNGIIEGNKLVYSYEPRSLTPNGTKKETFTLKISNTGNANANDFWITIDSKPNGLWFDFQSSATIQDGNRIPCQQKSSYCTIGLVPKESSNMFAEYNVEFNHKLYQEIVNEKPKLFFNYGFDEGEEQTIEILLKFD